MTEIATLQEFSDIVYTLAKTQELLTEMLGHGYEPVTEYTFEVRNNRNDLMKRAYDEYKALWDSREEARKIACQQYTQHINGVLVYFKDGEFARKVTKAIRWYRERFGAKPNMVYVNSKTKTREILYDCTEATQAEVDANKDNDESDTVYLKYAGGVLPHHIWVTRE